MPIATGARYRGIHTAANGDPVRLATAVEALLALRWKEAVVRLPLSELHSAIVG
jgi:hypothetical protein